jgi:hypothetical protein
VKKFLCVILFILLVANPAWGAVKYVRPANDCTGAPCGAADGSDWDNAYDGFADIAWTALDDEESTLYISGGSAGATYAERLIVAHDVTSRLYIKPGSASPSPSGHNGKVTIRNRTSSGDSGYGLGVKMGNESGTEARYVTIDGETTPGSGTVNIAITENYNTGIGFRYDANQENNTFRYLEITRNGFKAATTLTASADSSDISISVADSTGCTDGTSVFVTMDNGQICMFEPDAPVGNTVPIQVVAPTPYTFCGTASSGNKVEFFTRDDGIYFRTGCVGSLVEYCEIEYNGGDGLRGIIGPTSDYAEGVIRYSSFIGNFDDAIQVSGGLDIYDNEFDISEANTRGTSAHADLMQLSPNYIRLWNNYAILGGHQGIFLETVDTDIGPGMIYNNVLRYPGITGNGPCLMFRSKNLILEGDHIMSDFLIANNICDGGTFFLRLNQDVSGTTLTVSGSEISNNISYGITGSHFSLHEAGSGTITYTKAGLLVYSNIFYDPDAIGYNASDDSGGPYDTAGDLNTGTSFTGNTNSQPTFTNYSSGDYSLAAGDTVAKNAGKDLSAFFTTDILGNTRTGTWDIGAYEYQSGALTGNISGAVISGAVVK